MDVVTRALLILVSVAALLQPQPNAGYARQSDVIYSRRSDLALTMEVLIPPRPNRVGVVWVVSSSGRSSPEQTFQPTFERRVSPFLSQGYTVFAVMHSVAPKFQVPDYENDVRRAVRFVRHDAARFGIDPGRLGIVGSSSGGLIALLVALRGQDGNPDSADSVERVSGRVQVAGAFFSPTDLTNFGDASENILDVMRQRTGKIDPSFPSENLADISPVTHVTRDDPPILLIHGNQDKAIPIQQSRRLMERLQAARVPARFVEREGKAHAWDGWESDSALVADWFTAHLRPQVR